MICGILVLRLHAVLALLFGALVVSICTTPEAIEQYALARGMNPDAAQQLAQTTMGDRIAQGFGRTCGQIGIVIAMASIIGSCLLKSGAADRIVRSTLKLLGERRAAFSFLGSGFLLGIPVFFDTVFYLMIPLGKAMRMRVGSNYLLYIMAIVAGATMAHSLVPPTPGPLFVANELGVDLGVMILAGGLVGIFTSGTGYLYAQWANRQWTVPLRESEESLRELESLSQREESQLPSLGLSLLPILLPVILIAAQTAVSSMSVELDSQLAMDLLSTLGNKNIALILAATVSLIMLLRFSSGDETVGAIKASLSSAGVIILITSSGGAFGNALQQTGIASTIEELSQMYQISIIPLAFVLTALIRTAQGSATVAMITAAGIFAGMADAAQLGFHPVYLCLAIGCGSKPIWWMNDSGFWVVSQMSGMKERESLKALTPMSVLMGLVGLVVTVILAALFPLM